MQSFLIKIAGFFFEIKSEMADSPSNMARKGRTFGPILQNDPAFGNSTKHQNNALVVAKALNMWLRDMIELILRMFFIRSTWWRLSCATG
jgi:hypothetical protein